MKCGDLPFCAAVGFQKLSAYQMEELRHRIDELVEGLEA
jgi:hypothetical protein